MIHITCCVSHLSKYTNKRYFIQLVLINCLEMQGRKLLRVGKYKDFFFKLKILEER